MLYFKDERSFATRLSLIVIICTFLPLSTSWAQNWTWTSIPGAAKDVGANGFYDAGTGSINPAQGKAWVVGVAPNQSGDAIYERTGNTWTPGHSGYGVLISIDLWSRPWVVNAVGNIYLYSTVANGWQQIPGQSDPQAPAAAVGQNIWVKGTDGKLYFSDAQIELYGGGQDPFTGWHSLPPPGTGGIKSIATINGFVYIVDNSGSVFKASIRSVYDNNPGWSPVSTDGKAIKEVAGGASVSGSRTDYSVYYLGTDGKIYSPGYNGLTEISQQPPNGNITSIAVQNGGDEGVKIWALNSSFQIFTGTY